MITDRYIAVRGVAGSRARRQGPASDDHQVMVLRSEDECKSQQAAQNMAYSSSCALPLLKPDKRLVGIVSAAIWLAMSRTPPRLCNGIARPTSSTTQSANLAPDTERIPLRPRSRGQPALSGSATGAVS